MEDLQVKGQLRGQVRCIHVRAVRQVLAKCHL